MAENAARALAQPSTKLRLRVRNGCRRWLTWECELPQEDVRSLPKRLLARGFSDVSQFERVAELIDEHGHAVVIVPSTGRVQIRVHYLTPHEERQQAALTVAWAIEAACGHAPDHNSPV